MAKIYKQITDLIGKTPLVELGKYSASKGLETPVIAKVEFFNPGGSVKDRIALAMIEDAEQKGILKPGACCCKRSTETQGIIPQRIKLYDITCTWNDWSAISCRVHPGNSLILTVSIKQSVLFELQVRMLVIQDKGDDILDKLSILLEAFFLAGFLGKYADRKSVV